MTLCFLDTPLIAKFRPSPNFGLRKNTALRYLVLHYTGMPTAQDALDWLCNPVSQVSCHYFIFENGRIVQLVEEDKRAWHAGKSCWEGEQDMNSASIGVEIANPGHDGGCPAYPAAQINAVMRLTRDVMMRWSMPVANIVAHSDIAPERKADPGEFFPWARLAEAGLCLWAPPPPPQAGAVLTKGDIGAAVAEWQHKLAIFGYGVKDTGEYDARTTACVRAFQRRFRPARIDGVLDGQTRACLDAALELKQRDARLQPFL